MRILAEFRIRYRQLLDARDETAEALPDFAQHPQQVPAMYRLRRLVRIFDTQAANWQRMRRLGPHPSCPGRR